MHKKASYPNCVRREPQAGLRPGPQFATRRAANLVSPPRQLAPAALAWRVLMVLGPVVAAQFGRGAESARCATFLLHVVRVPTATAASHVCAAAAAHRRGSCSHGVSPGLTALTERATWVSFRRIAGAPRCRFVQNNHGGMLKQPASVQARCVCWPFWPGVPPARRLS